MSAKPNYFKIGLFILVALLLLLTGIILLGSGVMDRKKIYFETCFEDSVSGLSQGAPVQDNGVQIGTVERISFIRNDYSLPTTESGFLKYRPYVRVVCSVRGENIPEMSHEQRQQDLNVLVENGMRLRLSTNILTGQALIEADYLDPQRYPIEPLPWKTEYPYIPSAPSTFTTLKDSVDKILHNLEQIDTQKIADNLDTLLETINRVLNDAEIVKLTAEFRSLLSEVSQTNQGLKKLIEDPTSEQELTNIAELVDHLDASLDRIDQLVRVNSPQVSQILENFRQITDNLKALAEDLQKNPSMILSEPPSKKESAQ